MQTFIIHQQVVIWQKYSIAAKDADEVKKLVDNDPSLMFEEPVAGITRLDETERVLVTEVYDEDTDDVDQMTENAICVASPAVNAVPIETVENLFNIDSDEEIQVIRVDALDDVQRSFLGLPPRPIAVAD